MVEDLKRRAYGNVNALVRIDRRAIVGPSESLTNPQDGSDLKHTDCSVIDQGIRTCMQRKLCGYISIGGIAI